MVQSSAKPPTHPATPNGECNTAFTTNAYNPATPLASSPLAAGPLAATPLAHSPPRCAPAPYPLAPLPAADAPAPDPGPGPSTMVYGAIASHPATPYDSATALTADAKAASAAARRVARQRRLTVAASTSFFGIPRSFSSFLSTRSARSDVRRGGGAGAATDIDWVSLGVVYLITLVSEASRGLVLPSTWPYFRSLGGTKDMLGVFVAALSLGRMVSTVPLGWLSDRHGASTVLAVASLLQAVGHLAYAMSGNLAWLYASRVLVGFGSATMSVCRAHLARAIPAAERTHHFAYLSALQFIGFAVLPGVGGLLALLPHAQPLPVLALNGFTYPALVLVVANVLCAVLVHLLYVDPPAAAATAAAATSSGSARATSPERATASPSAGSALLGELAQPDAVALAVCMVVNVVFRGVIAELETVFVPFLMEEYTLSYGLSSMYLSAVGFVGLGVYVSFKPIARRFADRGLVAFGLGLIALGCVPLGVRGVVAALPSWAYVGLVGLTWSIGYPVGQTAVLSLFSKVLGGLPAGSFLGMFSAAGSLARLGMAIVAGRLWNALGRDSVFAVIVSYVMVTAVVVGTQYRRLVPASL